MMKTFCLKTLGCKVNQYETQSIREQFIKGRLKEVESGADVYVINTCTVTEASDRKSRRSIREAIRSNPKATVIVTGCYAERRPGEILDISGVSFVFGNGQKDEIARLVAPLPRPSADLLNDKDGPKSRRAMDAESYLPLRISDFKGHTRAFVKIQDGCDNFCSYCIVPFVRGRPRSRKMCDVVSEAERLVDNGFKEIVLTGVQLGRYGSDLSDGYEIADVIEELEKIAGLSRIRLSSIEPPDVTNRLIEKMRDSNKMCRHLHIPLQSGDDSILRMMNRNYTPGSYLVLIERLRKAVPQISITTDVMIGFPGEGEGNFENTLKLIERISPSRIHIFPYSKREETLASGFKDQVPPNIVRKRVDKMKDLGAITSLKYRRRFLDRQVDALVETARDKKTGLLTGYTETYIKVLIGGQDRLMNKIVSVKLIEVEPTYTLGRIISHTEGAFVLDNKRVL